MLKRSSVDHTRMHEMNMALILQTLRLHAPVSRAGLAALTGLNKATVSSIVRKLLLNGLIRELGANSAGAEIGRPAINLELDPEAGYIIGAEIGVDFIAAVVTNFALEPVIRRHERTTHLQSAEAILDRMMAVLREIHTQVAALGRPIFGIGLGVPGLVDLASGTLLFAPNLGWRDVPLRDWLAQAFALPVYVGNEANMAAQGESYFGAGQQRDPLLFVSSGVGLGGGIVLNGQVMPGAAGFAGEFGHMMVDPEGMRCSCGKIGCWETVATQRAVFREIADALAAGQRSTLAEGFNGDLSRLTMAQVTQAARAGDKVALHALEEAGRWLGVGISNLVNAINPQCVVFGGPMSVAHEFLLPVIKAQVEALAMEWMRQDVEIVLAAQEAESAVMGAAATVHAHVTDNPAAWLKAE
ncbi:MAG: ROK family transcriptional regulator [Anaerolineae bacterium]|nr:ROK family transcriptional regulator [Anaerolineae bacterium]